MATVTPRLGLRKPGGGDNVTVLTDLDNNYDILDRAVLVAAGTERGVVTGGMDVSGSPTGYLDELRFPNPANAVAATGAAISTLYTGSPRMYFDHRGNANAGDWYWRNGTDAGTSVFAIASNGRLSLPLAVNTAATVGAAGAAAALPATPVGYLLVTILGTDRKIPYYNV